MKNMKSLFKSLLIITVMAFIAISCNEDDTTFKPLNYPADAFVTFDGAEINVVESNSSEIVVTVALATINQTDNVTVDFTISSTDAILGTHYEVVGNKTQFSIASGSYSDDIRIKLIDNPDFEDNKTITITLTGNSTGATVGYPGPDSNGTTYNITIIDDDCLKEESLRPYQGTWSGDDNCGDDASEVRLELACLQGITIKGLGYPWLEGSYWGETVTQEYDTFITIDAVAGTITIPKQKYVETDYNGTLVDYFLEGSGTIDISGAKPVMHIVYDMTSTNGSSALDYGGSSCATLFEADITLD
jgi:hypothetical protein